MLRRKGDVYQAVLNIANYHGCAPKAQSHHFPSPAMALQPSSSKVFSTRRASLSVSGTKAKQEEEARSFSISATRRFQHSTSLSQADYCHHYRHYSRVCPLTRNGSSSSSRITRHSKAWLAKHAASSTYDPQLAAYMDHWVRTMFMGQRRAHYSLAKPIPALASDYSTMDIPNRSVSSHGSVEEICISQHQCGLDLSQSQSDLNVTEDSVKRSTERRSISISPSMPFTQMLADFRQSIDAIDFEKYALPRPFHPIGSVSGTVPKRMLTQAQRKSIDDIWLKYRCLTNRQVQISSMSSNSLPTPSLSEATSIGPQTHIMEATKDIKLMKKDYTKLLHVLRYSSVWKLAAERILTVQNDMRSQGLPLTRKMYQVVAQAHIILNDSTLPETILQIHEDVVAMAGSGTKDHKKLVGTIVDAFAANQLSSQGIAFLDRILLPFQGGQWRLGHELRAMLEKKHKLFIHGLYRRLILNQSQSKTSSPPSVSSQDIFLIRNFAERHYLPQREHVLRTLQLLNLDESFQGGETMKLFSRTVAGMLVKTGDSQTVIPLVQNLVRLDQFQEATRVMDMMIQNGMDPEMDQIRLYLLHHFDACRDGGDLMNIIDRWDEAVAQREQKQKNWSSVPSDKSQPSLLSSIYLDQEQSGDDRAVEYFRLVDQCIRSHDIQGALSAAKYIAQQGWAAQGLDFQKLNSVMVNHSYSSYASSYFSSFSASDYLIYLQVRYTLGGSVAPDLHTYRRLVFAACRRSDLYTALTLFELVRTRHPTWKLDSTIYNAIISTAAAIGEIRIAEKTFKCLLKDEVQPDHYSFHGLLNGYGNSGNLKAAITVPKMMLKHKLQPTTRTFNLVMKAYLSEGRGKGDLATSRKLLRAMQLSVTDKGKKGEIAPDLASFNQILEGYRRVGNTLWFDAYFDQYFGSNEHSRQDDLSPTVVKPEEADDRTLFIQLKHSLKLADVDLTTVRELWQAIEHKLKPSQASSPPSSNDHADFTGSIDPISSDVGRPTENLSSTLLSLPALSPVSEPDLIDLMGIQDEDGDTLPSTHIPFPRWLDPVWMPMTDYDYFRFTTLRLFRSTFQAHGDVAGVKTVESILADLFPAHPISQAVLKRRMVKRIRHAAKLKERESSDSMGYLKSKTISIKNRGK